VREPLLDLAQDLRTRYIGRSLHVHKTVPSTQDLARSLAEAGAPEGTVVVAEVQTAGRGRMGRLWVSPPGGLWMSVLLRPIAAPHEVPKVSLVGGVAVARAIERTCGLPAGLRWPNDVLVHRRKVAGVLAEAGPEALWIVLGIGVNANIEPQALPEGATSLLAELGRPVSLRALFSATCAELEKAYELFRGEGFGTILAWWRERSTTLRRRVRAHVASGTYEGVAEDVDEDGALLLRLPDGRRMRIVAGDVT